MASFLYTFTHKGFTVEYRITAPSKSLANRIARQQERAWRLAVEFHVSGSCGFVTGVGEHNTVDLKEHAPWS